jgi:hypothetical protein
MPLYPQDVGTEIVFQNGVLGYKFGLVREIILQLDSYYVDRNIRKNLEDYQQCNLQYHGYLICHRSDVR